MNEYFSRPVRMPTDVFGEYEVIIESLVEADLKKQGYRQGNFDSSQLTGVVVESFEFLTDDDFAIQTVRIALTVTAKILQGNSTTKKWSGKCEAFRTADNRMKVKFWYCHT